MLCVTLPFQIKIILVIILFNTILYHYVYNTLSAKNISNILSVVFREQNIYSPPIKHINY
jgi:hypothetical protein